MDNGHDTLMEAAVAKADWDRKDAEEAQDLQREPSARPTERRILNENPAAAPAGSALAQLVEGRRPAALGPRNTHSLEKVAQRNQRFAQVPAIIDNRVGGLIARSKQRHNSLGIHFSTRKGPITSASIPELKKVRTASAGELTIASPRRLNDVFITTGTPVRLPNSEIKRQ